MRDTAIRMGMIGRTLIRAIEDGVLVLDKKRALALGAEMQSA